MLRRARVAGSKIVLTFDDSRERFENPRRRTAAGVLPSPAPTAAHWAEAKIVGKDKVEGWVVGRAAAGRRPLRLQQHRRTPI